MVKTIEWTDAGVAMIDQTRLPREVVFVTCRDYREVAEAIRGMVIRGAPAIGVAAAMGVALAVKQAPGGTAADLQPALEQAAQCIGATRPTAVNLFWAIARMKRRFAESQAAGADAAQIREAMVAEARQVLCEDIAGNQAMGRHGAPLVPPEKSIMTHCNAGALASGGYGTALGVIRAVAETRRQPPHVFSCETRPFLQGARLTAWELQQDGIPVTLITDNMAGHVLKSGRVGCIIVGADRIARNGDVANKIGTYGLAVLAKEHGVPFYVAAPISTLDLSLSSGDQIPIEHRSPREVTHVAGVPVAPEGIDVENPAFDVTPHRYVAAIITERGVARAPYAQTLANLAKGCAPVGLSTEPASRGPGTT
jgi:methylthioribose-1-phosphate isomerase